MSEPAILTSGLTKSFGDVRALDGVDLEVAPGTVLGLLGPNGAGKTTAVRILTTLLKPDAGSARVAGLGGGAGPAGLRAEIGRAGRDAGAPCRARPARPARRGRRHPHGARAPPLPGPPPPQRAARGGPPRRRAA